MSGIDQWAEELRSYGLNNGPEKNVCSLHFKDKAIKTKISRCGFKESCDYCGEIRQVLELEDLAKFLMETVMYYFRDPGDFASYNSREGGYLIDHSPSSEILENDFELEIDDSDLHEDILEWLDDGCAWSDANSLYGEGQFARPDSWSHFCYLLKHEVRYLFHLYKDNDNYYSYQSVEILKEIGRMINKYKLIGTINPKEKIYRCRQHTKDVTISCAKEICAPKVQYTMNPNRFSPAGISMFYCAFDKETTHLETIDTSWKRSKYTTAEFEINEDINIVDLTKIPSLPSVFDQSKRKKYSDLFFLNSFVSDLTKPIARDGKVHIDYVPTQVVTEYFRHMFNKKIHGIAYPSSRNKGGKAMVLFYDHYESLKNLTFIKSSLETKTLNSYLKNR
ncbi:HEPN-associated N-terminal domain-containing protein [Chryseobacterium indologenes]|uniref:HEPN-associated N-terminal domain-containing protein n=1 Tax=Chryseobacterium indologenes TaxID=253 RepID=UPI00301604F4